MAKFQFKPFSTKQRKLFLWWQENSPVKDKEGIIADGAIRSGKTLCMSLSYVMWAMENFEGQNFGMCGKTIGSFRRNVLAVLKLTLIARGYTLKDHRADNMLTITKGKVKNYFYIFGGKDEASQDLVQGITLAGCFFDEVALMPESFVNQATGRCSVEGSKFWFNCNPEGPAHWFKKNWIDERKKKDLLYLHFTMDDNLSLTEKIKKRYRNMYSGVFFERFILGLWVIAEGIIYDMFDRAKHVVDELPEMTNLIYIACDYGTQNATVFKKWQLAKDTRDEKGHIVPGKWYSVDEYYYSGRDEKKQKTDSDYVNDMREFVGNQPIRAIIVDPAAASFIAALRDAGYPVIQAKNDVKDGIRFVSTCLNTEKIAYLSNCVHTIEEYGQYAWDEKACERGEDAPLKINDHCMDSDRYFIYTILYKKHARIRDKHKEGL